MRCRWSFAASIVPGGRSLGLACVLAGLALGAPAQDEVALKAAIVFNLLQFVQWPEAEQAAGADAALTLCLDRQSDLWAPMQSLQLRPLPGGHVLKVQATPPTANGLGACDAWFIDAVPGQAPPVSVAARLPLLVIGDGRRADDQDVTVRLRKVGERIGFEVDLRNARRAGLQISSKLLRLAAKVDE